MLQMLIINRLINGLEALKNHFFRMLENGWKLDGFILKPGFFILLLVLLVLDKIFAFQVSLTLMIIFYFLNNLLISMGQFEWLELSLDLCFHVWKWLIDGVNTLLDLTQDKSWLDSLLNLIMELSDLFHSFTLKMGPKTMVTVLIYAGDGTVSAWKTVCMSDITWGTFEPDGWN